MRVRFSTFLGVLDALIFLGWTFWIGLNADLSLDGQTFRWSDETDLTFTNWNSDEPNGVWTGEHCVEMSREVERQVLFRPQVLHL